MTEEIANVPDQQMSGVINEQIKVLDRDSQSTTHNATTSVYILKTTMEKQYGFITNYLTTVIGQTPAEIQQLQDMYLEKNGDR